ncbi:vitamin-D-receptor interacting mediator subunit 4-domain-containing protein [Amylocystis lapponica]|nr:vitamin-D-receptor interacting mediator subunit 4-domain-containing protein [Amylocystis lapponica]
MSEILLDPLNHLQALSQQLFQSLGAPQTKPPPAPSISTFLSVDAALASAVQLTRIHQVKQRKIEQLKNEVLELDRRWRQVVQELDEGRKELEVILREGEERTKAIEEAKAASIPYPELLAYAQSLSAFTSAPPNMPDLTLPGQPPPPLFFPPFPNEEKMRRGHMNDEAPLGLLGETHSVGRAPMTTVPPKSVEPPAHIVGPGANPYRPDQPRPPQPQFFDLDLDLNPDL